MKPAPRRRRFLLSVSVLALGLLVVLLAIRTILIGLGVGGVLKGIGASEFTFNVVQATAWNIVVEDLEFQLDKKPFSIRRVSLTRAHWWLPSLGTMRVEQAKVLVNLDPPANNPPVSSSREKTPETAPTSSLPIEDISVDGQLIFQTSGLPDQTLTVKIKAHPTTHESWDAQARVDGPGLSLQGEGSYELTRGDLAFKLPDIKLDLKTWEEFLQRIVPLPAGAWEIEGKFSGSVEGRLSGGEVTAGGKLKLREGRAVYVPKAITAEGIEAELEFTDLNKFITKPGRLDIRELRIGKLPLKNLAAEFAFLGMDRIAVSQISLLALGGSVSAEPFGYAPSRTEFEAVLLVDGIRVEEVMALTQDLPAKATGRVNGHFPVHIDGAGLRLGTGWLELKPGVHAEIQFNAKGLLTSGAAPTSPSYAVLKKIENGLLNLKINELRLDIRPPNAPEGRSAQLHLKGEPMDKEVKAPVTLDLNVNGPLEKLLNMGLDSRLSVGAGK